MQIYSWRSIDPMASEARSYPLTSSRWPFNARRRPRGGNLVEKLARPETLLA